MLTEKMEKYLVYPQQRSNEINTYVNEPFSYHISILTEECKTKLTVRYAGHTNPTPKNIDVFM